nr:TetR/AcrR family transcriptional regulator C-terminal ligand-binding domain-containing protein [Nocardia sp. BMG51109]
MDTIFARVAERGEVRPEGITWRMKTLPFDLLRQEFMMTFSPVPDRVLEEIVNTLFLPLVQPRGEER